MHPAKARWRGSEIEAPDAAPAGGILSSVCPAASFPQESVVGEIFQRRFRSALLFCHLNLRARFHAILEYPGARVTFASGWFEERDGAKRQRLMPGGVFGIKAAP